MPQARKHQINLEATAYYHCISRCVRRAFLCGFDRLTSRSFEHRRQWIVDRMKSLGQSFAIDIYAYAIMSNHFHIVVKVQQQYAQAWTVDEVIQRWTRIFSSPTLVQRYNIGDELSLDEMEALSSLVNEWRARLCSISWFMRALNEPIARMANREDDCTGRFWEGRFVSQALLDDAALLTAMAYVDLNPIRAGIAKTLETSDYTSIQERVLLSKKQVGSLRWNPSVAKNENASLCCRVGALSWLKAPIKTSAYLDLVEWTGLTAYEKSIRSESRDVPPILKQLRIREHGFIEHMKGAEPGFYNMVGTLGKMRAAARVFGMKFFKGQSYAKQLFGV